MQIIPSVLVATFLEFETQIRRLEKFFPYIQIDRLDGKFVETVSFPEIDKVAKIDTPLRYELHLMVEDPVSEMRRWQTNEKVFRVLIHAETPDLNRSVSFARKEGWDVGLSLNPETPVEKVAEYLPRLTVLQFMTVHPGRQGSEFLPAVVEKIREFSKRKERLLIAVDGGVNEKTIKTLAEAGVDIVYPGSAFTKTENVKEELEKLKKIAEYA